MQTITDSKTRALTTKSEIANLVGKAKSVLREFKSFELRFLELRDLIMLRGWVLGGVLNELKEKVGHGNWEKWLPSNLPELGDSIVTRLNNAKRYMKLWKDNHATSKSKSFGIPNDLKRIEFNCDSERKFMWSYIPEKERPKTGKDHKFARLISFLNIVNEYNRLRHRHVNGLQLVDFDEAREETVELHQFLKWLHRERTISPWQS